MTEKTHLSPRDILAAAKAAPPHRPLSRIFDELFASPDGPITIAAIRDALADRSFGALLLFFAAINCLPLPPGSSTILAIPILLLSAQLVLGYQRVWLPARILRIEVPPHIQLRFNTLAGRWLKWFEQFVKPRYWPFTNRTADIAIGLLIFCLSVVLLLPIPLGNWTPAAAIFVFSLSLIERDGLTFCFGIAVTLVALFILVAVLTVGTAFAKAAMSWWF
jgi:hypothetical protein